MKIQVNLDIIKSYNPCRSGLNNFIEHYKDFDGCLSELLTLDNINYSDKIWLATKMVDTKTLQQWSVECAEKVLGNFEKVYPNDKRVRECLEVTKKYLLGECTLDELNIARSAAMSAAWSAARSARSAAYSAAESAAMSAVWSAARSAAESARSAAYSAYSSAESAEETLNLSILIALIDNLGE